MNRRTFIKLTGGAAAAWPLTAIGQQPARTRRIGALMYLSENDPESKLYTAALQDGLQKLGWNVGRNVEIDYRWTSGDAARIHKYATELVGLAPDVLFVAGGSHVGPLQQATHTLPIVFVQVADAVGAGFVKSLARPGGNATGFTNGEFDISTKWLELLKQMAPRMTRTAVLRDPSNPSGSGQFGAIQAVSSAFGIDVSPLALTNAGEIERGMAEFAREPNGGVVVTPSGLAIIHRALIITQAARLRLPTIYPFRYFVTDGGLISYGPDVVDQYRRAAGYIDRILKGQKPADLPVQRSTKVDLVINLKTAKALGVTPPPNLLASADAVIK
ncbi:MAG TPA: ABC transporter substrate-binding protein [Candidatus Binatus sp.]|nr:ABC transporter substrate-binding protein [Candidatus Binatus sp.]